MPTFDSFVKFDDAVRYREALECAAAKDSKNFVVDFGSRVSWIASNVGSDGFKTLMEEGGAPRTEGAPARWINIWAPDLQPDVVDAIGLRYGFSERLKAILRTTPPANSSEAPVENYTAEKEFDLPSVPDVEQGIPTPLTRLSSTLKAAKPNTRNFFNIAANFSSYQSIDIGEKFICIGANWMHPIERNSGVVEPERLWSWIVLCDDATVISFHEDPRPKDVDSKYIKTVRKNTLSVLSQLSIIGWDAADGVELISLRQRAGSKELTGIEGASNLFYYLFDDWTATYTLLMVLQGNLEKLRKKIMAGLDQNRPDALAKEIIPKLYELGKLLRSNQHLFKGYENLITRILKYEYKEGGDSSPEQVSVTQSACRRFERLQDNIRFLVLNYVEEAIGEIEGLHNTYFNITTQKDSMATAKLTSNATLLSKLGVLFLPLDAFVGG
ncbi:hypothetical protein V496_08430 [Pseudogymnoascus sp. VKM F-4515 (FW-2607)]|nr:hypothetical protein V496_08430 [Pseudogymnoascus sp. VKM F-4515 (FW-2607)]